jgi:hypothetical protein
MLCRFVITDLRVCMSSSFSIISSPYMVDRKGVRRTFRRTFFFMGLGLICYLCLCFGQSVVANMLLHRKHLDGCLLWQFICLCVLLLVPVLPSALFSAGFLQVTPPRLAVHFTLLLTSVNYNIVFLIVRHLRFCCPYFIMCYLHSEFDSSVCYIFPSLAMGSFKLTLMPRSDTSSLFPHSTKLAI